MALFRSQYVGETLFPQRGPNGGWWMLYGRMQFLRIQKRYSFAIRFRKHARGWFFGIGPYPHF